MTKTTLSIGLTLFSAACLQGQNIQEFLDASLHRDWDPGNAVEVDGSDQSLDTNTTSPGLFQSTYGNISGNTINRADFKTAVANAFDSGLGGVMGFENNNYSGGDWIHPTLGTTIARTGANAINAGGLITINRGDNWWFEGSEVTPYRGKHTAAFDGTGPSGPDRTNYDEIFFMKPGSSSSKEEIGTQFLEQTTSYDFDFNPADQVTVIGFAMLNYDNFQSLQDTTNGFAFYPNMHAIATWTNGTDTITHMSVGLSAQSTTNDHYFGFAAPDGYYLDRLQAYQIGNTDRSFIGVDEMGFVVVPEPSTYALIIGILGMGLVLRRRFSNKR